MQANFVIDLGEKAQVPIISFSATSPSLTSLRSSYFFQVAQNDSSQVKAISAIIQAYGWREAVPIYIDNEYGQGIIPFLIDALQNVDARVPYRSAIPSSASDDQIGQELYKLMTMQTRVFIVHMSTNLSSRLFTKAKEIGMMSEGYVWIITSGMTNSIRSIESSAHNSMQGVLGVKTYVPNTKELENFTVRWKRKFHQDNPTILNVELNVIGLWAYDAFSALARAVEIVGTTNFGFEKTNASSNLTDLETFGVSLNGPKLREALWGTRFRGLSGEFSLDNGQLQSSTFQIINVNGNGEREIAFWTPENGLVRKLNSTNTSTYSTSRYNLGPIIWPGDSSSVPKGWEIPTNGKKLRIGVPVKDGFSEFVKNFDAVVGDTTIIANRSNFVDFTLPYTESGVSMIVPIKDSERKNAWVFLKPLTWDLWITSGCFFVFIGFVIWVLEHRINEEFRGPPSHEIGTSLWYSFSTMVFAQLQQLQPTVTDVNQLIKSGEYVGYLQGSFVLGILKGMGFDETKLKAFPIGSPLVSDVSRAILNVTEGEKMKQIEKAWLGEQTNCPDSSTQVSSGGLSLASFWGLFLIAGSASLSALIISVSMFLYKERHKILVRFDSERSIWRRVRHTFRIFDGKDLSSHTFRKRAPQDISGIDSVHGIGASDHASPNNNYPPSPSSCSVHIEPHFDFSNSGTPPREYCHPNPNGHSFQLAQAIELIDHPNQEEPRIPEIAHENC
uniref:Ionotropic glutamate receptor C-terminal domain-containing protein n=1 Tax=Fagus sylvatica TaxID=28930 RepID=A0A2N9G0Q9_FAGSY